MAAATLLSNRTYVETPENVRLAFRLAGPGTRLGAYLLDLCVRTAILYALMIAVSIVFLPFSATGLGTGIYLVGSFLMEWFYGCVFETWWNGQTPGKRAFRLRVIKTEGYAIGFYEAMLRNLLRAADFFPVGYAMGFIVSASNPRMQRIGDLVAGTMVVRERRPRLRGELEGLRDYPPIAMSDFRHHYRPSEKTLEVIESLYRRRLVLAPMRIDEIAMILAEPLGKRLETFEQRKLARERPADFLFRVLRTFRAQPQEELDREPGGEDDRHRNAGSADPGTSRPGPAPTFWVAR